MTTVDLSIIQLDRRGEIKNYEECKEYIKQNNIQITKRIYHPKRVNKNGAIITREIHKMYLPKRYYKKNNENVIEIKNKNICVNPRYDKYGYLTELYIPSKYNSQIDINDNDIKKTTYTQKYITKNNECREYNYERYSLKISPDKKQKIKLLEEFISENYEKLRNIKKKEDRIDYVIQNINKKNNTNFTYSRSAIYNQISFIN